MEQIEVTESPGRLKVVIPIRANRLALALSTMAMLVWVAMLAVVLAYLLTGRSTQAVLTVLLAIWLVVWLLFGRFLWRRWQYYAARREILYVEPDQIILRRPVSILGLTSAYDRQHISPLYVSERHHSPAFDYAYAHVYFGETLPERDARRLVDELNALLFPGERQGEPAPQ
jgi:hypothetical protein